MVRIFIIIIMPHVVLLCVPLARANRSFSADGSRIVSHSVGAVFLVYRVHDNRWWLGINLNENLRDPRQVFLISQYMDRVVPPPRPDAEVLFHGPYRPSLAVNVS